MKKVLLLLVLFPFAIYAQTNETITFVSDGLTFNGTLSIPQGQGPFPVAILVHGSGPSDRNQTIHLSGPNYQCLYPGLYGNTVRNFQDIANYLSGKGIAVLRYDKRTFTHGSTLDIRTLSYFDMVNDVHAAIDYVNTRTEIRTNSVILIGHSKGVNQVALVAQKRPEVSHVIGLAGPASGIDSILADQIRYIYNECDDPQEGEQLATQIEQIFSQVRNNTWNENMPIMGVYPSFWREWINVTDSSIYHFQQLEQPVLIIQAEDDFNVPVLHGQLYKDNLDPQKADVYFLPGINHFLTTATVPNVAPALLDTVYQWLQNKNVSSKAFAKSQIQLQTYYSNNAVHVKLIEEDIINAEVFTVNGMRKGQVSPLNSHELVLLRSEYQPGIYLIRISTKSSSGIVKIAL